MPTSDVKLSKLNVWIAGLHGYVDNMFEFCRQMGKLGVDNAEYALLTAMTIFAGTQESHI